MERVITVLPALTTDEVNSLAGQDGIRSGDALTIVTFPDITEILTEASVVVKCQKLSLIGSYLARGQTIEEATMRPNIVNHLNTPVAPVNTNQPDAPLYPRLPPPPPTPRSPHKTPDR